MTSSILEALRIISESWPLAVMLLALCGGATICFIVARGYRASERNTLVEADRTLRIKQLDGPTPKVIEQQQPTRRNPHDG